MKHMILQHLALNARRAVSALTVVAALWTATAHAAVPGIGSSTPGSATFALTAHDSYLTQPDGAAIYSWGYGCASTSGNTFLPLALAKSGTCPNMQVPGPTLIVHQGDLVTVTLTNNLPAVAGNTSMLFPGFQVTSAGGAQGLLTQEAATGQTVTYTFPATTPGTHSYYSGTQGDLQVEMGMYGALIVLPAQTAASSGCDTASPVEQARKARNQETDFRLGMAAYDHPSACYDREYLFQLAEMDPKIHRAVQAAVAGTTACPTTTGCPPLNVATEPYHPTYFMFNGRSMPDDMDSNYAPEYPNQPYNANPHMHPGELVLLRIIGQGRWQHPFHEHGNHVRILARDGNLILSPSMITGSTTTPALAGPLLFTTTSTPGLAMDGIFYWTGKGLNWDVYGHNRADASTGSSNLPCVPDANGYNTGSAAYTQINFYEWCADHQKPLEKAPFGDVGAGGPVTLADPNYLTNGAWYGGSAYLGPEATARGVGPTGTTPPAGTVANSPSKEAAFAYMWHSHNEREITTNNLFPGGLMAMMLVDPWTYAIDEAN